MREYERKFHERCKRIDQYQGIGAYDSDEFAPAIPDEPVPNVWATALIAVVVLYVVLEWWPV